MRRLAVLVVLAMVLVVGGALADDIGGKPDYQIIKDEVFDSPAKTQVEIVIIVKGPMTKDGLEIVLSKLYREALNRKGFKHHKRPTAIYVQAWLKRADVGKMPFFAALQKHHNDKKPKFELNDFIYPGVLQE